MDKIPEERVGTVVRDPWIKSPKRGLAVGTVVRGPLIKYQKRGMAPW